jgi:hypothetical protein
LSSSPGNKSKWVYNEVMRRPLIVIIAAFVLAALVSASAQRGGMRSSGGGRGVAVGHSFAGHSSGGHAFGGMHTGPSMRSSFFRGEGFRGGHIRTGGFHHCYGCRFRNGYPLYGGYGYAGYYDPYWWWDSSSSYNYDEERTRELALASEMNAVNLEEQNLRERENWDRERDQDSYARRPQARAEEQSAAAPATVLVFRDQHQQEVRNYAIAGGTLWVLNEQTAKKIPLAELDLAATAKMNDERGVDFQVPK